MDEERALRGTALNNRVAVVTGAGSIAEGIGNGRAIAIAFARQGARIVAIDRDADSLAGTAALLDAEGARYEAVVADVTDESGCHDAIARAGTRWGRVDVLVNNVGIAGPAGTVVDIDLDGWATCWRVNVDSMVLMSRAAIPLMRTGGGGSIVNISSILGMRGGHPGVAYPTTKAAVIGLTRAMAQHHGAEGIRVNAIAPGFVFTPMVWSQGLSDSARARRRRLSPLGVEGDAWDTANAVVFLAGDGARWITGSVLTVDGGVTSGVGMASDMSVSGK